nr:MAG TPA: hypothetical protein [Microviridae sp.]
MITRLNHTGTKIISTDLNQLIILRRGMKIRLRIIKQAHESADGNVVIRLNERNAKAFSQSVTNDIKIRDSIHCENPPFRNKKQRKKVCFYATKKPKKSKT